METRDGAYIKKLNRSHILEKIIEYQAISRADLSKLTGLNKATISVQVSDLLEKKLIYETQAEHKTVGRRPILLSINQTAGHILGVDFNYKSIQFVVSDLLGNIIEDHTICFETTNYHTIITMICDEIKAYQNQYTSSSYGLISCVIGIHGTIDKSEKVKFIPKYQWSDIDMKQDLQNKVDIPLTLENNANLSAFAEKTYHYHHSSHLLSMLLSSGIGAGSIIEGEMNKGYNGYAGEMGHMIIFPTGSACQCGNNGCWELYASEPAFFNKLSQQLNRTYISYENLNQLIIKEDPITHQLLCDYIFYVAIGLNNVINLYNPGTIVLNSKILQAHPNAIETIKENMTSNVSSYDDIVLSSLGDKACVIGACALGIQRFFKVSELLLE